MFTYVLINVGSVLKGYGLSSGFYDGPCATFCRPAEGMKDHPPRCASGCSSTVTPGLQRFPQFRVRRRGVAAPPPKGPVAPHPCTPTALIFLGGGGVALPPARGLAGSLDLRNPVALQGVEQLHLRISRYTLKLSLLDEVIYSPQVKLSFGADLRAPKSCSYFCNCEFNRGQKVAAMSSCL